MIELFLAHPIIGSIVLLIVAAFLIVAAILIYEDYEPVEILVGSIVIGLLGFLFYHFNIHGLVYSCIVGLYSLFMELPWFWSLILVVFTILALSNPVLLTTIVVGAGMIYLGYWIFTGELMSVYGFFTWSLFMLALVPLNGVPLIVMAVGGYAIGRWMAKL